MLAIAKAVAFLNVVAGLATPVTHLTVVLAPGIYGAVTDGNLGPSSSFAFKVGGLVHVAINAVTYAGNGVGSGKLF